MSQRKFKPEIIPTIPIFNNISEFINYLSESKNHIESIKVSTHEFNICRSNVNQITVVVTINNKLGYLGNNVSRYYLLSYSPKERFRISSFDPRASIKFTRDSSQMILNEKENGLILGLSQHMTLGIFSDIVTGYYTTNFTIPQEFIDLLNQVEITINKMCSQVFGDDICITFEQDLEEDFLTVLMSDYFHKPPSPPISPRKSPPKLADFVVKRTTPNNSVASKQKKLVWIPKKVPDCNVLALSTI